MIPNMQCTSTHNYIPLFYRKSRVPGQDNSNGSKAASPEEPEALIQWREAVKSSNSASQVAICINQLDRSIAWEKSPMKVVSVVAVRVELINLHLRILVSTYCTCARLHLTKSCSPFLPLLLHNIQWGVYCYFYVVNKMWTCDPHCV